MKSIKENSTNLKGPWEPLAPVDVYLHVQTMLRITPLKHKSTIEDLLVLPELDDAKSDADFVQDFMRAVGDYLSPRQLELLIRAFSKELTAWAKQNGSEESMNEVFRLYEELLEAAVKKEASNGLSST